MPDSIFSPENSNFPSGASRCESTNSKLKKKENINCYKLCFNKWFISNILELILCLYCLIRKKKIDIQDLQRYFSHKMHSEELCQWRTANKQEESAKDKG